jgi:hypothetical protein
MMIYKNTWGSPESGVDQQRADMFRVSITLPRQLGAASGANVWDKDCSWAVEKFPFPERDVETIPIKYLQQTNHQIGGDVASEPVIMNVRYAFNQRTAVILERWRNLIANPNTGGVALSSLVKTNGFFFWLVPNEAVLGDPNAAERDSYKLIRAFELHGCWLRGLKPLTEADHTSGTNVVVLEFKMQIDRYYPVKPEDLQNLTVPNFSAVGG